MAQRWQFAQEGNLPRTGTPQEEFTPEGDSPRTAIHPGRDLLPPGRKKVFGRPGNSGNARSGMPVSAGMGAGRDWTAVPFPRQWKPPSGGAVPFPAAPPETARLSFSQSPSPEAGVLVCRVKNRGIGGVWNIGLGCREGYRGRLCGSSRGCDPCQALGGGVGDGGELGWLSFSGLPAPRMGVLVCRVK